MPKPAVIIQPINSNDVIESLKFAKKYNIRLFVQSTGHHQDHRNRNKGVGIYGWTTGGGHGHLPEYMV